MSRDARAEAIRGYSDDVARLRQQARDALASGYGAWFYELRGLVAIAERAMRAELDNPRPKQ